MFNNSLQKLESLEPLIEVTKSNEIETLSRFLYERISNPDSYLVFLGETSSGKSSIINGFLGENILPVKAYPTTAAITEIELTDNSESQYMAINKDATARIINKDEFVRLAENIDNNISRLRISKHVRNSNLKGLRIFDTPGYGSIIEEHDEILKNFIPNSDIIVYVVSYRIGIQDEDFNFLRYVKELIRDDVEVILLINRCPENIGEDDCKVREICRYAEDLLGIKPAVFLVENTLPLVGESYALPQCDALWNYVGRILSSEKRTAILEKAFDSYIFDLYHKCDSIIQARYASATTDEKDFQSIIQTQKETASRIRKAIPDLINPTFDALIAKIPSKIKETAEDTKKRINTEIDKTNKGEKEEMVAFTNEHLLPYTISRTSNEHITEYIETILTDLNSKVDDYIQKEIISFSNKIIIKLNSNLDVASKNVASRIIQRLSVMGLGKYFAVFGGAGGANAGIANAASHMLKKFGDLFGHTFSRATHNSVKHLLKKIGATSMKTVAVAVAVIIELLVIVIDRNIWRGKLKRKVSKGLDKWAEETTPITLKDINKLRDENIDTINQIAYEIEHTFEDERASDINECIKEVKLSENIGNLIGINN